MKHPADRFDRPSTSHRVGAHRVASSPHRLWSYLVGALFGVVLLTGTGIVMIHLTGTRFLDIAQQQVAERPSPPRVTPKLDPDTQIVVLNGTHTPGFGQLVDDLITQNTWGTIVFSGDADSDDVEISAVFYASADDAAAALGLAQELGGVSTFESHNYTEYGANLIVLLGADYRGPGSDSMITASSP